MIAFLFFFFSAWGVLFGLFSSYNSVIKAQWPLFALRVLPISIQRHSFLSFSVLVPFINLFRFLSFFPSPPWLCSLRWSPCAPLPQAQTLTAPRRRTSGASATTADVSEGSRVEQEKGRRTVFFSSRRFLALSLSLFCCPPVSSLRLCTRTAISLNDCTTQRGDGGLCATPNQKTILYFSFVCLFSLFQPAFLALSCLALCPSAWKTLIVIHTLTNM